MNNYFAFQAFVTEPQVCPVIKYELIQIYGANETYVEIFPKGIESTSPVGPDANGYYQVNLANPQSVGTYQFQVKATLEGGSLYIQPNTTTIVVELEPTSLPDVEPEVLM